MSFDSFHFLSFFLVVLATTYVLRDRVPARNTFLLIASYYFYGCWDWRFLGLIVISTIVDYGCGLGLAVSPEDVDKAPPPVRRRKLLLLASLITNLGLLAVFKYFNFFTDSAASLLGAIGFDPHMTTLRIVLPVGISFYTFQTLSYTIDLYRGRIATERNLLTFALYVAFFPQLVAGPIERAKHLLPQLAIPRTVSAVDFGSGAYLVFWGLFKKVVIADNVSGFVSNIFSGTPSSGLYALLGIYAFAIQIYCDFSGYSDIARGTARCLGFDLMLNFNLPYFATNPSDFWRRWHISLSSWLRDYLYIGLGGNRVGLGRNYYNLMMTMVLGGLWHGAAWVYVLWGFYQGVLLCGHRMIEPLIAKVRPAKDSAYAGAWHVASIVFYFQLTCLGWLIFRAESVGQVGTFLKVIFGDFLGPAPGWVNFSSLAVVVASGAFLFVVQLVQYRSGDLNVVFRLPVPVRAVFYAGCFLALVIFGRIHGGAFIYFQF
jgi:D-alanyl-lipoteichoic acid acyltransferase DltB (MBOAT superfamily)